MNAERFTAKSIHPTSVQTHSISCHGLEEIIFIAGNAGSSQKPICCQTKDRYLL
jgi:hypothetical protein